MTYAKGMAMTCNHLLVIVTRYVWVTILILANIPTWTILSAACRMTHPQLYDISYQLNWSYTTNLHYCRGLDRLSFGTRQELSSPCIITCITMYNSKKMMGKVV